ncbi:hypothetical protein DFO80_1067 [Rhodobacter sp. 140A]|nr:hypothetical protein DFO80_1067 [Rhodobacter sp. 140A]
MIATNTATATDTDFRTGVPVRFPGIVPPGEGAPGLSLVRPARPT